MQAWDKFLHRLENELGADTVNKWLRSLKIVNFDAANLYLEAADSFQISWFNEHIRPKIKKNLLNNNFRPIKVHLTIPSHQQEPLTKTQTPLPAVQPDSTQKPTFLLAEDTLDPYATLDHFIVGEENKLIWEFFSALCGYKKESSHKKDLGQFNPIYLYGESGTGKSHLLMGLANEFKEKRINACYVKMETFTANVVSAIRSSSMQEFRQAYRHVDVLIVDDVHVLAKKSATQEEFFHTFNTLHTAGKQIILSGNCAPSLLQDIEPRLVSRFEWGIALHLQKLGQNELLSMLEKRCTLLQFPLQKSVLLFLLSTFSYQLKSLHRAIEALILRTHSAHSKPQSDMLTEFDVKVLLKDLIEKEKEYVLSPKKIVQVIADYYGIKPEDIMGKSQSHDCAFPRQIAMYICREQMKMPFTQIGQFFHRDHSTVIASVKSVLEKISSKEQDLTSIISTLQRTLQSID